MKSPTAKISHADQVQTVKKSFGRAVMRGDFISRFYEIFLPSHPDIKPMFASTDFTKQKELLRHGINLMIMYAGDSAVGKSGIARIAKSHSVNQMNIKPQLYQYWQSSLLEALAEFDADFTGETKKSWEYVLSRGVEYIKSQYAEI